MTEYTLQDGTTIMVNEDQICYSVPSGEGYKTIAMSNGKFFVVSDASDAK